MYEPTYRRLAADFVGLDFEPLLINDQGDIHLDGAPVTAADARPDAAWANADVFSSPAARNSWSRC